MAVMLHVYGFREGEANIGNDLADVWHLPANPDRILWTDRNSFTHGGVHSVLQDLGGWLEGEFRPEPLVKPRLALTLDASLER